MPPSAIHCVHLTLQPLQALSEHVVHQYLGAQQVRQILLSHAKYLLPNPGWVHPLPYADVNDKKLVQSFD